MAFLKAYERSLTDDFQAHPSSTAFLLMAKLKPASMVPLVRKLFALPRWSKALDARVAVAALGDHVTDRPRPSYLKVMGYPIPLPPQ